MRRKVSYSFNKTEIGVVEDFYNFIESNPTQSLIEIGICSGYEECCMLKDKIQKLYMEVSTSPEDI